MSNNIKAVVFDADGTLFDTASLIYDAYKHIAELHGYETATREQIAHQMGKPIPEILSTLFPGADVAAMMQTNNKFIMKRTGVVVAFNGLEHTLSGLRQMDMKLAILTSGGKKIENILSEHGLLDYFGSVVHAERVSRHKPDPEGLRLVAQELDIEVSTMVMVGDMRQDIEVAKNAGAYASVGVTHGFSTREDLESHGATTVIDNLPELIPAVEALEKMK